MTSHRTTAELTVGLADIQASPADHGPVDMILVRPDVGTRRELEHARVTQTGGLEGDSWATRPDPDPLAQVTLMNTRAITLIAGGRANWPPAGDNLFVDIDMSPGNLPPGTRLALGTAEIEITAEPHTGCGQFIDRYGRDACVFANVGPGKALRMRGLNARVIRAGEFARGDKLRKIT